MKDKSSQAVLSSHPYPLSTLWLSLRQWCELIKIEHTIFALPFALSGLVLASNKLPGFLTCLWTIIAFVSARAYAMSLNRVIDAEIDRKNPRTCERAIPKGQITKPEAIGLAVFCFCTMLLAACQLPPLCLKLLPVAVIWLFLYPWAKRFTWWCHLMLGIALGGAALGGWIAAGASLLQPAPWLLAIAVITWVTGFDLIYACLDIEFDRQQKLSSLPAAFGLPTTLIASSILHIVAVLALISLGLTLKLRLIYWLGVAACSLALIWEHSLVTPTDLSKANAAFFNANGLISILIFLAILSDKIF